MAPLLFSLGTFFSTLIGGFFALKHKGRINQILSYTAGVLLGLVAFEILPEISRLSANDFKLPMIFFIAGFLGFHVLEKLVLMHASGDEGYASHKHPHVGVASAVALIGHSFLDGVGIGLGFQAGTKVGVAVAIAVIAHDFSDGLNTVSLLLSSQNKLSLARRMLTLDATAPLAGTASTLFFSLDDRWLAGYLAFFAGFLLYISASNILPQAHREGSSKNAIWLSLFGVIFMYLVSLVS